MGSFTTPGLPSTPFHPASRTGVLKQLIGCAAALVLVVSAHRADAQELAPAPVPLQPELLTTLPVVSLDATIFAVEPFAR